MIYSPGSVKVAYSFMDTQMTCVFSRWLNSQTRYQDSCNGLFQPQGYEGTRSGGRSIPISLDSFHIPGKVISRVSLNQNSPRLNPVSKVRPIFWGLFWILRWPGESMWRSNWGTLIICCGLCGVGWGLRHMVVHWLYVATVRPIIFPGSLVWWPGCQTYNVRRS
jgi:hypothetical protein